MYITSNFVKHLKNIHPENYQQYLIEKNKGGDKNKGASKQERFDDKVIAFLANTNSPISVVDNKHFTSLFEGTGLKVMGRKKATNEVEKHAAMMTTKIKKSLKAVDNVCATADIWSGKQRSFFGYTCHWLGDDLQFKSAALACKRFSGTHSFDRIAEIIKIINKEFGLTSNKLTSVTTDNASNFVKAFKECGLKPLMEKDDDDDDSDEEENFVVENIQTDVLPTHQRCATHTLHLLATTDFNNILKAKPSVQKLHLQVRQYHHLFYYSNIF